MKSHAIKLCLAVAVASMCYSQQSSAIIINDNYEGASSVKSNGTSYGDVIGRADNFQINYMDVSISGNILSVSIDTTFAGSRWVEKRCARICKLDFGAHSALYGLVAK